MPNDHNLQEVYEKNGVIYPNNCVEVLDKGFVKLIDVMGDDKSITSAARISYGKGTKKVNEDRGLIRYLMRHDHTTPFEMVEFKFHVRMPIFVARQWIRHRTANVNEYSGRYSEMPELFYVPEQEMITKQSTTNKQGGTDEQVSYPEHNQIVIQNEQKRAYNDYQAKLHVDMRKELARINLPLSLYTEMYWKIDCKNLLHFLKLRCDSHSQYEIRVYAETMLNMIEPIVPITIEAWRDYQVNNINLTALEIKALKSSLSNISVNNINSENKREKEEWKVKAEKLGLNVNE